MTDWQPTERIPSDTAVPAPRRRVRIWPIAVGVLLAALVAVTVVLVLVLTDGSPSPVTSTSTPPQGSTPVPSGTPVAPPPVAPPNEPRPEAGPNECVDDLGDGGSVDLDRVQLAVEDGDLAVQFVLASGLPDGESGLGVYLESGNGRAAYQLGIALVDGELDRFFLWNGEDEDDLDPDAVRVDGSTVTALISERELRRLGEDWGWYGFAAVEDALDACPGTADAPQLLPYEPLDRGDRRDDDD